MLAAGSISILEKTRRRLRRCALREPASPCRASSSNRKNMRIFAALKYSLLPIFVLFGLVGGIAVWFQRPDVSEWIWFATLILGGWPIVLQTIRGMLRGQFASDIVAMLAIVTAILLGQAF